MSIAEKAIWIIESRRAEAIALDEVAMACGVSRFHLSRAFTERFGRPLIAYLRARRLTEAARALVHGDAEILTVALDAGYASHEAFTRAFRSELGVAPSELRRAADLRALPLTDPPRLETTMTDDLNAPEVKARAAFRVAGLARRFARDEMAAIPALWSAFRPFLGSIDGQCGVSAYGLCLPSDEPGAIEYMTGVEVAPGTKPDGLETRDLPAARYAVFEHHGHVSEIRRTFAAIFDQGLTDAGLEYAGGPEFELYCDRFDPRTGSGVVEIWMPVNGSD